MIPRTLAAVGAATLTIACQHASVVARPAIREKLPARTEQNVQAFVDGRFDQTASMARQLWEWAEVGYQESKSSKLLQDTLTAEGFTVEAGVAGIPTAFVASYGSGRPVIAVLAEYDALPGINQAASPERTSVPGKGAGHACGHNLFGAGSVQAAVAVKAWLAKSGRRGPFDCTERPPKKAAAARSTWSAPASSRT